MMITKTLLGTSLLCSLSLVFAEPFRQFSDIYVEAKLKGSNATLRNIELGSGPVADPASFRFYKDTTAPFRVPSLPGVPFDIGEMYSGLMPIKAGDPSRALFFIFQPQIVDKSDTLTIWLNGGPGCSSLEGFFQENGRFLWGEGRAGPHINDHSWVNVTNMLWVEYPVGTGFTVGTPTAKTQEEIAQDFLGFFKNFQNTFGIKNFKVYVTGESYAGRYVPYISAAMLDQKNTVYYDVQGAMMYDGCIGAFDIIQQQVPLVPFLRDNMKTLGLGEDWVQEVTAIHEFCGYQKFLDTYLTFPPPGIQAANVRSRNVGCDLMSRAQSKMRSSNSCFDIYMINKTCPRGADVMKASGNRPAYFNRQDVKAALHAPLDRTWALCGSRRRVFVGPLGSGPEREGDLSADPIQRVLPQVVEATKRVIVANGNYDMIIITNGTLLAVQNMTWEGQLGFQKRPTTPINIPGQVGQAGIQHFERGLLWSEAFKTGHMGPEWAPELALRQMEWLLGKRDSL